MVDVYNDILDIASNLVRQLTSAEIFKKSKETISNSAEIKSLTKEIEKSESIRPYFDFVRNANNRNVINFESRGQVYSLDYEKRKWIVYYIVGGLVLNHLIKMKYFRRFVFNYVLFSALFCRENFDLNNYKITKSENKQI